MPKHVGSWKLFESWYFSLIIIHQQESRKCNERNVPLCCVKPVLQAHKLYFEFDLYYTLLPFAVCMIYFYSPWSNMDFSSTNQWKHWKDASPPTSGKFCSAKALAMLWSSVQLMASAIASTPRQLAAVSCFSGDHQGSNGAKDGERTRIQTRQTKRTGKPKQEID